MRSSLAITVVLFVLIVVLSPLARSDLYVQIGRDLFDPQLGYAQGTLGIDLVSVSDIGSPLVEELKKHPEEFDLRSISEKLRSSPNDYNLRVARNILLFRELLPIPLGDKTNAVRERDLKSVDEDWLSLAVLRPDDPVPIYYRGLIAYELSESEEAISLFERAQGLGQADVRLLLLLSQLYLTGGDWNKGLAVSTRGAEIHENSFFRKTQLLSLIALERYDDALRSCEASLRVEEDPELSYLYAVINLMVNRPAKAAEILESMRVKQPIDKEILSLLLQARRRQGRPSEIRALEELLRREFPDDPKIRELLEKSVSSGSTP